MKRRNFIQGGVLASVATWLGCNSDAKKAGVTTMGTHELPVVISTWNHGMPANEEAVRILNDGGTALDAVEGGVKVIEADPENKTVGIGGYPDRDGHVTLDACIMDHLGNAGSVCFLENILHPISVARKVMEETPHVMLAGEGALEFALQQGFEEVNLLTPETEKDYKKWLETAEYKPVINIENHDTISQLAIDSEGRISGACTTSGMAYKMHGRVGDSPIIGAGMYCDGEVGAAAATGHGEQVMKTLGSFLVVELMRQGKSPQEACQTAVERITKLPIDLESVQIGYIALDKHGNTGAYSLHPGFNYALYRDEKHELIDAASHMD